MQLDESASAAGAWTMLTSVVAALISILSYTLMYIVSASVAALRLSLDLSVAPFHDLVIGAFASYRSSDLARNASGCVTIPVLWFVYWVALFAWTRVRTHDTTPGGQRILALATHIVVCLAVLLSFLHMMAEPVRTAETLLMPSVSSRRLWSSEPPNW